MSQYRKLLLITETAAEVTPAFTRAVHLARATRAGLHIVVFCSDPAIEVLAAVDAELMDQTRAAHLEEQQRAMHLLTDPLAAEGIASDFALIAERPLAETVLSRIDAVKPDLVIKDVQPEPLLKRLLLQPLDWQLLNLSPAPLLLVNPHATRTPTRIVAAVDSGVATDPNLNDEVIKAALALAIQCQADAHLVHVAAFNTAVGEGRIAGVSRAAAAYLDLASLETQRFRVLADRFDVPAERRHLLSGAVAPTLAKFAHDAAGDVLVIGAAYRTGLERVFLGRSAQAILQRAHCDVMVVKPAGFDRTVARS